MANEIKTLDYFVKMPMMQLPCKSTLVKCKNKVVLISPALNLETYKSELNAFGKVTDIIAPNGFHHLGVKSAITMFPDARVWGVPILKVKRADIKWENILGEDEWPYNEELLCIPLSGMPRLNEVVFFHKSSKTLIVTDLFFNHIHGKGIVNWIIFNLFGTYKRFAISKFFLKSVDDKEKFNESLNYILSLNIEKIIIPHGENIEIDGSECVQKAMLERGLTLKL